MGTGDKNLPANEEDIGLIPGPGRFQRPRSNQAQEPQLLSLCAAITKAGVLPLLKPVHPGWCTAPTEACPSRARALQ